MFSLRLTYANIKSSCICISFGINVLYTHHSMVDSIVCDCVVFLCTVLYEFFFYYFCSVTDCCGNSKTDSLERSFVECGQKNVKNCNVLIFVWCIFGYRRNRKCYMRLIYSFWLWWVEQFANWHQVYIWETFNFFERNKTFVICEPK